MKVIYEFNTDSENYDRYEHETYKQAPQMLVALGNITNTLRSYYKYDDRGSVPIDEFYEKLWDCITDAGVDLERMGY